MTSVPDEIPSRPQYRFGKQDKSHDTLFAFKVRFTCDSAGSDESANYDITFDIIDGELPFLIGQPSLLAMQANLKFRSKFLGISLGTRYIRVSVVDDDNHILLPFHGQRKRYERDNRATTNNPSSHFTPSYPASTTPICLFKTGVNLAP